jgi:hypothetical protein
MTAQYRRIPLASLFIDLRYQRPLDEARVARMARDFRPNMLGTLEVSAREKDRYAVFDGQHRFETLLQTSEKTAPCLVHSDLTPKQEAELFVRLQLDRVSVKPLYRFKALIFAGDEEATALAQAVREAGYVIEDDPRNPRAIRAAHALENIWQRGGAELIKRTFSIVDTWVEAEDTQMPGVLIEGLAIFLDRIKGDLDEKALRRKLSETPTSQIRLRANAAMRAQGKGNAGYHVAHAILELYNSGRKQRLHLVA